MVPLTIFGKFTIVSCALSETHMLAHGDVVSESPRKTMRLRLCRCLWLTGKSNMPIISSTSKSVVTHTPTIPPIRTKVLTWRSVARLTTTTPCITGAGNKFGNGWRHHALNAVRANSSIRPCSESFSTAFTSAGQCFMIAWESMLPPPPGPP